MKTQSALTQESIHIDPNYLQVKRVLDLAFLALMALFILPLVIIIAVMIRLDSRGSVIFRQKRIGLLGAEFNMLKFRSMYGNSDDTIHREAARQFMNGYALSDSTHNPYKLGDDPRITRVGRFLRKTSLDELPQFWNVLRGEMTLVGPRPPLPYEVDLYSSRDRMRLCGKPGLTGPWQVYGRNKVTFREMVEMDITYLQQQSIWMDIKLVAKTVPVMLQGRGE